MSSPSCTRQDKKINPCGVSISLSGTPLLAEASLRGARPCGKLLVAAAVENASFLKTPA
jgi:hypothetical protein